MSRLTGPTTPPTEDTSPEGFKRRREAEYREAVREARLWIERDRVRIEIESRFGEVRHWVSLVIDHTFEVEILNLCLRSLRNGTPLEEVLRPMETRLFARQQKRTEACPSVAPRP